MVLPGPETRGARDLGLRGVLEGVRVLASDEADEGEQRAWGRKFRPRRDPTVDGDGATRALPREPGVARATCAA